MSRLTLLTAKHKSENNNFTAAPIRYFSFIVLLKFIAHGCVMHTDSVVIYMYDP